MRAILFACCVLASTACLRGTEYRCSSDNACGGNGVCEVTGFCSFPDGECSSGYRYNASAGNNLAGSCTTGGGMTGEDANDTGGGGGDDTMMPDTMSDTQMAVCPNGYTTISGGQAGHQYMVLTTARTWQQQEDECQLTTMKSHLATPDDIGELTAIDTFVDAASIEITYWVGVTDMEPPSDAEGTFYSILGTVQTFLPWLAPAPDDAGPGEDCVEAIIPTHQFNDARCGFNRIAVCECAP